MSDLDAGFQFLVLESRTDQRGGTDAVDLVVLVVGVAEPIAHRIDAAFSHAPLAAARPFPPVQVYMVFHLGGIDARDEVGCGVS